MTRADNPIREKARILWLKSGRTAKNIELAEKLGVSSKSIQRWKKDDAWERTPKSRKTDSKADTQKAGNKRKKAGVPALYGNQNAAGHGAPVGSANNLKHGKYSKRYWDCLNADEVEMLSEIDAELQNEEQILIDQIALYTVRERRLMQLIKQVRDRQKESVLYSSSIMTKPPTKEELKDGDDPDKPKLQFQMTRTENKVHLLLSLEDQLTKIQERKSKCVTALADIRLKRMKSKEDNGKEDNKTKTIIYIPDNGR